MITFATLCNISCRSSNMTSWLHCDAERPQLLNRSFYPLGNSQNANCYFHNRLRDHNLYRHNFCTDLRSWSNDPEQQRQHFLDVVSGRVSTFQISNTLILLQLLYNSNNISKTAIFCFINCL